MAAPKRGVPLVETPENDQHGQAALNASLKATQQLEELDVHLESLIGNLVGQQLQLDENDETIGRIEKKTHKNAELISKVEKDAHKLEKLSNCCTIA